MAGYTRQQSYIDGDVILAEHTNDEFDILEEVFSTNFGHKHDGTVGGGGLISKVSDADGDTYIDLEETADVDSINVYAQGSKKLSVDSLGILISDRFRISYNAALDTLDIGVE